MINEVGAPASWEGEEDGNASPPLPLSDGRAANGRVAGVAASGDFERHQHKKLAGDHLVMLEMHMAGFMNKEIAQEMGCTAQTVCMVITSELGQEFIAERAKSLDAEFFAQYHKVIKTIDDGLSDRQPMDVRLTAADKWLKAHGRFSPKKEAGDDRVSAEEIVQRLLERSGASAVHIKDSNVVINAERFAPPAALKEVKSE